MGITENRHTEHTLPGLHTKLNVHHTYVNNLLAATEEEKVMRERSEALQKEHNRREALENLRIEYATETQKLNLWMQSANDEASAAILVSSVEEIEALLKKYETFLNRTC